jgi:hypothetical protein
MPSRSSWRRSATGSSAASERGALTAAIVVFGGRRDLIAASWLQVIPVAGAALAYGAAAALGGSGFIAAFVAGGLFGGLEQGDPARITRLTERRRAVEWGHVSDLRRGAPRAGANGGELACVALCGSPLDGRAELPVAIAMLGTGARWPTLAFLGWFGPRGLASIVFALIVVQESDLPQAPAILVAPYFTVGLWALLHGVSAAPLADRYARWYEAHPRNIRPAMESGPPSIIARAARSRRAAPPGDLDWLAYTLRDPRGRESCRAACGRVRAWRGGEPDPDRRDPSHPERPRRFRERHVVRGWFGCGTRDLGLGVHGARRRPRRHRLCTGVDQRGRPHPGCGLSRGGNENADSREATQVGSGVAGRRRSLHTRSLGDFRGALAQSSSGCAMNGPPSDERRWPSCTRSAYAVARRVTGSPGSDAGIRGPEVTRARIANRWLRLRARVSSRSRSGHGRHQARRRG